jgi:ferric-dicitrate binding protein FerR (iron transport regulator)
MPNVHRCRWVLLALVLALLYASPALAQGARAIGTVGDLVGRCLVTSHGETEARPLSARAEIYEGDRIRTGTGARLRLELIDGSVVQLGEQTDLTLDWFLRAPDLGSQNVLLRVSAGIFRAIVELALPRSAFEVQTATAVASVRGTDWIAEAAADATAIVALDGRVAVRNIRPGIVGEVVLGPGEGTTVEADEPPTAVSVWGEARRTSFIDRTTVP